MLRFFIIFSVLLIGLFTLELLQPAEKYIILPFTSMIADISVWIVQGFDDNVIASNTDAKGRITYVSNALCKISGFSRDELIGKPHNIFRHPDMSKDLFTKLWNTILTGEAWIGEFKNIFEHICIATSSIGSFDGIAAGSFLEGSYTLVPAFSILLGLFFSMVFFLSKGSFLGGE